MELKNLKGKSGPYIHLPQVLEGRGALSLAMESHEAEDALVKIAVVSLVGLRMNKFRRTLASRRPFLLRPILGDDMKERLLKRLERRGELLGGVFDASTKLLSCVK